MKTFLAAIAIAVLSLLCSCGDTHRTRSATATAATSDYSTSARQLWPAPVATLDPDGDLDSPGNRRYDNDRDAVPTFGHAAGPLDTRSVGALIKRYYKAARLGDAKLACSMLSRVFTTSLVQQHGGTSRSDAPGVQTCARAVSKEFAQRHREVLEGASVRVITVRVYSNRGLALVRLKSKREGLVPVQLDRGVWKMNAVLANPV